MQDIGVSLDNTQCSQHAFVAIASSVRAAQACTLTFQMP